MGSSPRPVRARSLGQLIALPCLLRTLLHGVRGQTGSRSSPPWAATAQMTKMSKVMMSSDQNG